MILRGYRSANFLAQRTFGWSNAGHCGHDWGIWRPSVTRRVPPANLAGTLPFKGVSVVVSESWQRGRLCPSGSEVHDYECVAIASELFCEQRVAVLPDRGGPNPVAPTNHGRLTDLHACCGSSDAFPWLSWLNSGSDVLGRPHEHHRYPSNLPPHHVRRWPRFDHPPLDRMLRQNRRPAFRIFRVRY